jgi:hypothetical protein
MSFLMYVARAQRRRFDDIPVKGTFSELGLKANSDSETCADGVRAGSRPAYGMLSN